MSSTPLAARNLVYAKDIRLERRDVSSLHARPFKRIDDVAGQQVSRAIDVNEILTEKVGGPADADAPWRAGDTGLRNRQPARGIAGLDRRAG